MADDTVVADVIRLASGVTLARSSHTIGCEALSVAQALSASTTAKAVSFFSIFVSSLALILAYEQAFVKAEWTR